LKILQDLRGFDLDLDFAVCKMMDLTKDLQKQDSIQIRDVWKNKYVAMVFLKNLRSLFVVQKHFWFRSIFVVQNRFVVQKLFWSEAFSVVQKLFLFRTVFFCSEAVLRLIRSSFCCVFSVV
jgi:hypothetical protein